MKSLLKQTCLGLAGVAGLSLAALGTAQADTDLVVVSWGGAYTASQQKAYHEPYMAANPGIKILNDDSASEGVAKLRAQAEAGNVTWDLVDMVAADAIVACDEGLVESSSITTSCWPRRRTARRPRRTSSKAP